MWEGVSEGVLQDLFGEVSTWVRRLPESMIRLGDACLVESMLEMIIEDAPGGGGEPPSEGAEGEATAGTKKLLKLAPSEAECSAAERDRAVQKAVEAAGGLLKEGVSPQVVARAREGARLLLLRCR